ncbi:YybH family protein [Methylocapsa acidiphila]|uniref:YybH family protein n=1 Tax=Methylocapsa acidiphila TaxID=133552 RepID=UPI0004253168|nr:nuclear transport factor 2 family protein [Methylocapsa acidiphila]
MTCLCLLAIVTIASPAFADDAADKAAITGRLRGFSDAFNARDEAGLCDIFAPDLIATIPLASEADRETLCGNLSRLLARRDLRLHYDYPDIREIIVSGNIAVVRIMWALTVQKGFEKDTTSEGGIDIFRRQPDGRWSIARMAAFPFRPNKLLD